MSSSRRSFLKSSALASLLPLGRWLPDTASASPVATANGPVAIASGNGMEAVARAVAEMQAGQDPLDAVIAGVKLVEDDPDDLTVGYGGIPNEDGIVELDASVMHGPSARAGAVAALRGIRNPSRVAQLVLQRTDHVLLVGQGALDFARMHGFEEENLLTERSREIWVRWKENLSTRDDYLPPHDIDDADLGAAWKAIKRSYGTINCCGLDAEGNIGGVTTTSGLFFKIPGRVGDSPIIGAGLYVDNAVGAAGSTGRGEANLENLSSFLIVERMRQGDSPEEACLYACRRIAENTRLARLKRPDGQPNFNVQFYALNKAGAVGGASIYSGARMAVADANGARQIDMAYLYERDDD